MAEHVGPSNSEQDSFDKNTRRAARKTGGLKRDKVSHFGPTATVRAIAAEATQTRKATDAELQRIKRSRANSHTTQTNTGEAGLQRDGMSYQLPDGIRMSDIPHEYLKVMFPHLG